MKLPSARHYNPYRAKADTPDGDALWAVISDSENIKYMIGAIRVGHPAIDAIAAELCNNKLTAHLFTTGAQAQVDHWKQFAGKLVALALAPEGFHPVDTTSTYNNDIFKNGAIYAKE